MDNSYPKRSHEAGELLINSTNAMIITLLIEMIFTFFLFKLCFFISLQRHAKSRIHNGTRITTGTTKEIRTPFHNG